MQSLKAYAEKLDQQYQTHFAGHPRFSRDPNLLRRMAQDIRGQLEQVQDATTDPTLIDRLNAQVELFETEADSIDEIQAANSEDFLAHEYRSWIDLIFDRYRRNFAGRSRSDRELNLLRSLVGDLTKLVTQLTKLSERGSSEVVEDALRVARSHLELFNNEFSEIAALRENGDTNQRTSLLANDANRLFAVWKDFFAGRPRISRRVERLETMIVHLGWIDDQMRTLERPADPNDFNGKNRAICVDRAKFYTTELGHIREGRSQANFEAIVLALGESANDMFKKYRELFAGKDRRAVSLDALNKICEELYDLAIQMNELDLVRSNEANQQNLSTVVDQLRLFQREYDTIRKVQEGT